MDRKANMSTRQDLERAALAAHRRGESWADFWPTVAADVASPATAEIGG